MEFSTGRRRDGFYITGDEKQVEGSKHASFFTLSSSSSSVPSASAAFRWHVGPSEDGAAGDGRNGSGNFFEEKEHMFDKVVTPSDVGKLNRLVIPKQHAERYFPLDTAANEKGLLLSFEDRTGKSWRFRYSYWNSSQSYVMTKGWSRFVKEKRLDAGDVVSFGRGVGESGRDHLYIDWKPRPMEIINHDMPRLPPVLAPLAGVSMARPAGAWGGDRFIITPGAVYDHHHPGFGYNAMNSSTTGGGQIHFFRPSMAGPPQIGVQHDGGGGGGLPMVLNSMPLVGNQAEAKRVRLFGVNLDCAEAPKGNAQLSNGLCPSARHLQSISSTSTLPFLPFPSIDQSSMASSSQEQQLTLDLGL